VVSRTLVSLILTGCLATALAPGLSRAGGPVDLAQAQNHAVEASRAYEAGDLEGAVRLFQASIDAGLDHEVIHYNLGNAHYKQGNLGLAIASYLRALRRNPRDHAARSNLEQAQSFLQDEALAPLALPVFLRPLGWAYAQLSLNEWAWVGLFAVFAIAFISIVGQWVDTARVLRRRLRWAFLVLATVAFAMTGLHYRVEVARVTAVVVAEEVEVRSGPGAGYNLAFKIHEGLQVFVAERREDWVQIHLGGELVGWVSEDQLEQL
jgi:hypothetical protein